MKTILINMLFNMFYDDGMGEIDTFVSKKSNVTRKYRYYIHNYASWDIQLTLELLIEHSTTLNYWCVPTNSVIQ